MLSKRMTAILDLIPKSSRLIDVGCDHGLVGLTALKKGLIKSLVLTDISEDSLDMAKKNATLMKLKASFIVTDGLEGIKLREKDVIIITGMGAKVMMRIIQPIDQSLDIKLILGPQSYPEKLRLFMMKSGYKIVDEDLVLEKGKFYPIIKYACGQEKLSANELLLGPMLINKKHFLLKDYVDYNIHKEKLKLARIPNKYILKKLEMLVMIIRLKAIIFKRK